MAREKLTPEEKEARRLAAYKRYNDKRRAAELARRAVEGWAKAPRKDKLDPEEKARREKAHNDAKRAVLKAQRIADGSYVAPGKHPRPQYTEEERKAMRKAKKQRYLERHRLLPRNPRQPKEPKPVKVPRVAQTLEERRERHRVESRERWRRKSGYYDKEEVFRWTPEIAARQAVPVYERITAARIKAPKTTPEEFEMPRAVPAVAAQSDRRLTFSQVMELLRGIQADVEEFQRPEIHKAKQRLCLRAFRAATWALFEAHDAHELEHMLRVELFGTK